MTLRKSIIYSLVALLFAPSLYAQDSPDRWRSFAQQLAPGSFVVVHLRDGKKVEGRLLHVATDTVSVMPKTRQPVPVRDLRLTDVQSIDPRKESMSPGAKVLIGAAVTGGILVVLTEILLAGMK
jgi:hypothetical protein